jgi:hypothetical protein
MHLAAHAPPKASTLLLDKAKTKKQRVPFSHCSELVIAHSNNGNII